MPKSNDIQELKDAIKLVLRTYFERDPFEEIRPNKAFDMDFSAQDALNKIVDIIKEFN